jgi:hypothetical protein
LSCPQFVDPERFGIKAAADKGLMAGVFTTDVAAEEWLRLVR